MSLSMLFGADAGLGCAATVLQVHLGAGLVLMFASSAVRAKMPLGAQLEGTCWDMALHGAAHASSSAPLLAAHALIQVRGQALDQLSWIGLCTATVAVVLGAASVIFGPMFGAGANGLMNGDAHHKPSETKLAKTLALSRSCSALRGAALAVLPFGGLPSGIQLLCATGLVRLALLVHAGGAFAHAMDLQGSTAEFVADLEKITSLAPMVSCLTLLDHITLGPGSVTDAPLQPVVYCVLASLVQVAFVFFIRACLGGTLGSHVAAEFDIGFSLDADMDKNALAPKLDRLRGMASVALYAAASLVMLLVLKSSFNMAVSLKGFSIEWGESPQLATACLLQALIFGVYAAEFLSLRFAVGPKTDSTDGVKATSTAGSLKAIVSPAQSIVLALILLASSTDTMGKLGFMVLLPRYGFVMASIGVGLQVLSFLLFTLVHASDYPAKEPSFDCTGTLEEGAFGGGPGRAATLCLLQCGIALGLVGMGVAAWVIAGGILFPIACVMLPKAARDGVGLTVASIGSTVVSQLGTTFTCLGDFLEKRRAAQEAKKAKLAAERAAMLLEEEGVERKGKNKDKKREEKPPAKKEEKPHDDGVPEAAHDAEPVEDKPTAAPKKKKGVICGGKKKIK